MSKYGYVVYGGAKYGITPKLAYSVEPMTLDVIKFSETLLTWQIPTGDFSRFRVVRNQNEYSETSEDGIIIYEQNSQDGSSLEGLVSVNVILDGTDNPDQVPLIPGRNVFYSAFLYTADDIWIRAGRIYDTIPEDTNAVEKMINLLPRVISSKELSPFGTVDPASDLYQFLDGMAFTYEQWLTLVSLIRPNHNLEGSNYTTIPFETLNKGMLPEPNIPINNQRRLIREAIGLFAKKGTKLGVSNYAESLTGFAPTVNTAYNLMLTVQDSTFYKGTGRWVATSAIISSTNEMVPNTGNPLSIDNVYTMKAVSAGAGQVSLGENNPVTQGVPVAAGNSYEIFCEVKCPAGSSTMTLVAEFYDKKGTLVDDFSVSSSVGNSWVALSQTVAAPATSRYVVLKIQWNIAATYYIDRVFVGLSEAPNYDEARAINIQLAPKYENYIYNPSFEVDASGWTVTGATFSQDASVSSEGYAGTSSGKFVAASSWSLACNNDLPLEIGIYFSFSFYVKSATSNEIDATIEVYNADDELIDSSTETVTISSTWARYATRILVDTESAASYARVRFNGSAGTYYIDMVQGQDTYDPTDYFDGSMPELRGVVWEGTANNSTSLYYPTKGTKILRLAQTLVDWVPMNAWWRLSTPAGLEYTNLDV